MSDTPILTLIITASHDLHCESMEASRSNLRNSHHFPDAPPASWYRPLGPCGRTTGHSSTRPTILDLSLRGNGHSVNELACRLSSSPQRTSGVFIRIPGELTFCDSHCLRLGAVNICRSQRPTFSLGDFSPATRFSDASSIHQSKESLGAVNKG